MGSRTEPKISVVIPVYNQARFVAEAVRSALAQQPPATEVIVVDDGSTDETPAILERFRASVWVIRQANGGLAAARNAGILASSGDYIALLDADDEWLPDFLTIMRRSIAAAPSAAVHFGTALLIDECGHELPQMPGSPTLASAGLLDALLRSNFLIPSTMVLDRAAVLDVGLFREGLQGVEDRDLWLRMAQRDALFVDTGRCVVRYRVHGDSMSAIPTAMQKADSRLVEDLYGPDDGDPLTWSAAKRRIWGGHFRYCALSSVLRAGDWQACGLYLTRALVIDPTLAEDRDLFHELALGTQPLGWRGTRASIDISGNARELAGVLAAVFADPIDHRLAALKEAVYRAAFDALAQVAWQVGQRGRSREYLRALARYSQDPLPSIGWWRRYLRTYLPNTYISAWRNAAARLRPAR